MSIVGLISDTHGLLRPQALTALSGVTHIVHAGDVGTPQILEQLRAIAPVTAVRGNTDHDLWAAGLPADAVVRAGGHGLYVVHRLMDMAISPQAAGIAAVISGHTHKPQIQSRDGVLYVNPGSAGPRRFSLPISIGFLRLEEGAPPEAWLRTLDP